jgi:three-Cys-motif partner protein
MPKPDVNKFFAAQQGAAVLKLAVLKRYLYPFAMKIGSTAPGRRVVYLDPYAGKGEYDDGSPGSPLLAARTSHQIAENRILECLYAEEKRPVARRLSEVLATVEHPHHVWPRRFEDCLDEMLERTGLAPMFAFLDPFGLTIPFDALAGKVLKRSGKTEVLINVSLNGLWHHAGQLNNTSEGGEETRKRSIARLDEAMGGDWWQEVWARHSHAQRRERDEALVTEYVRRLATAGGGGWSWWAVDVPDRWEGPPAYYLAFMTRSMDGVWLFTDALSGAMDEFEIRAMSAKSAKKRRRPAISSVSRSTGRLRGLNATTAGQRESPPTSLNFSKRGRSTCSRASTRSTVPSSSDAHARSTSGGLGIYLPSGVRRRSDRRIRKSRDRPSRLLE